jgi:hypothetical protein
MVMAALRRPPKVVKVEESETSSEKVNDDFGKEDIMVSYQSLLMRYPLIINAIQSCVLAAIGVIVSQLLTAGEVFDELEIHVMMILNVLFLTPVLYVFYTKVLSAVDHFGLLVTLLVDQLLFSPLFTASIMILRLWMRGSDKTSIVSEVLGLLPNTMLSSWCFWIPARFIILKFVPIPLQMLVGNVFALMWNVIFAMIVNA